MTQEEKELVLKDLCGRLCYGILVKENRDSMDNDLVIYTIDYHPCINDCKPYLRPMSSMTKEEQEEFVKFHCVNICPLVLTDMLTLDIEAKMFEWLNAHHFDYRGLIEKGLALEAPKDMYK